MKGQVVEINQMRGMAAILTEDGDYSILEMLGDEVESGDSISWQGSYPLGSETITNHTQGRTMSVYFQNHSVHKSQLRQQLLY